MDNTTDPQPPQSAQPSGSAGYRDLGPDDTRQIGDEWADVQYNPDEWKPILKGFGQKYGPHGFNKFRRPISPQNMEWTIKP